MKRALTVVLSGCVVFLVVLAGVPAEALEPLVPYDNFTGKLINPAKWFGGGFGGTEAIRQIKGGRLRLLSRGYGDTGSDTGSRFSNLTLNFARPDEVTATAATIRVKNFQATGCPTVGSAPTVVAAESHGSFFNTGTPTPGSGQNDVRASVFIERFSNSSDPPDIFRGRGNAFQCTTPTCGSTTSIGFVDLGPVSVHDPVKLLIQWDRDNDRFLFRLNSGPEFMISYLVPDGGSPGQQFKVWQVRKSVANCTQTPQPVGFMDILLDDVLANESAAVMFADLEE